MMMTDNRLLLAALMILLLFTVKPVVAQSGPLPDWFASPKPGEYVGSSFPSEDVHSRPETALLSALLNYVACNINLGGPVSVEYTGLGFDGLSTSVAKRKHTVMLNYQLCRLETVGNDTYVSVKVDDKGIPKDGIVIKYFQELTSSGLGDDSSNMMCSVNIELEVTPRKKYTINTYWRVSDTEDEQRIFFYGEEMHSALEIEGKTIEIANYEMPEGQDSLVVRDLPFYRYCGDISKNGVGGAFWQSILQRLSEKVSGMDDVLDKEGYDIDWKHFKNTNEISGKKLYVMFMPETKTSKK